MELLINKRDITIPEEVIRKWQSIVNIMAELIDVPAALIMKVDPPYIEVFRSSESSKNPYKVGGREHSTGLYCEQVIKTRSKLLVPNALKDKHWDKNPDIKLGMISYLGFPLLWPDDEVFGTICVLDLEENPYNKAYEQLMLQFKELVEAHLGLLYDREHLEDLVEQRTTGLKKAAEELRREIGARKKAEEALQLEHGRLTDILETIEDGVYIVDQQCNIQYINPVVKREFGPVKGRKCYEYFHDRSEVCSWCKNSEVFAGKSIHWEWYSFKNDKYYDLFDTPFKNPDGSISKFEMFRDITERKRAEEALLRSKKNWENTFDSMSDWVFMIDLKGRVLRTNRAGEDFTGIPLTEIVGQLCCKLVHDSEKPIPGCPLKKMLKTGQRATAELQIPDTNRWLMVTVDPVMDEEDNITGAVHITRDITERKQAEQTLENLNKELQATVEKLTLANRELQHFAHIAAHDLKAPLRAIGTLADWISTDYADKFDEEGKREVELLVGRVARMSDMIDSILRYSEAGRVIKEKEKVNLNALIEEVMAGIAPPENISVTVENELPVLEGEKTHFMQVFQNLLSNAVKYMDKPIGQIKVGCTEENGFWKFSVADNGPGVEKEYFEKIFEMFQTLLPRDEFETTGIGLSIVKKIVETYGGRVWIESEVGKGSVFFFTLPKKEMGVKDAKLKANIVS